MSASPSVDELSRRNGLGPAPELPRRRRRGRAQPSEEAATTVDRERGGWRNSMLYRLKGHTRPWWLMAGLWTAGAATHLLSAAAGAGPMLVLAWVAAAAGLAVLLVVRPGRRRALGRCLAAAGWLAWVAGGGMTWDTIAVLGWGGAGLSLRYWRRIRIPNPPPQGPMPPEPDVGPGEMAVLWAENNACSGGGLPDSVLSGEVYTYNDEGVLASARYDLHLVPGKHTLARAVQALPVLRTGLLLLPRMDLILEQHTRLNESVLQMTVVHRSKALDADVGWPGRTYNWITGRCKLGPYIDADGDAEWIIRTKNRLQGGFLAGSIGSGKSRLLEAIALGYADAGCVVWFGDPQGGASSSFLADHADYTARSVDAIRQMLRLALRVKNLRQAENAINGWEGWEPEQLQRNGEMLARPGLILIIDEVHKATAEDDIQAMLTELTREGGKVGIAAVLADQVATLNAFGKGAGSIEADTLRSSVCSGNMVILRSMTRNTANVLPNVNVDPTLFPKKPGYAYLIVDDSEPDSDADESLGARRRTAPFRGYYLTDEARDRTAEVVVWCELDPGAAGAASVEYTNRRQQAVLDMQVLEQMVAAARAGEAVPDQPLQAQTVATAALPPVPAGPLAPIEMPRWGADGEPKKTTAVDVVCDLVTAAGDGIRPKELQERSGYSGTAVRNALKTLMADGRIHQPKSEQGKPEHGRYVAGPAPGGVTPDWEAINKMNGAEVLAGVTAAAELSGDGEVSA